MTRMDCASPEVAVCVVGQLRRGAEPRLQRFIRAAWSGVGNGCVDIYLSLGIEAVEATVGHGPSPAKSLENATALVHQLRPVEYHVSSVPMPTHATSTLDCLRDSDQNVTQLCHKGPSIESSNASGLRCNHGSCSHCAVTAYYGHASRLASCAQMAQAAASRLGRSYKFFVHHRPDLLLYGIPQYSEWRLGTPFGNATRSAALYCTPAPGLPPSDFLGVVAWQHVHLVGGIDRFMMACQSRRATVRASKRWCNDHRFPAWHTPECLLHAAYARGGVRVLSLNDPEHWPKLRKSCRIFRDRKDETAKWWRGKRRGAAANGSAAGVVKGAAHPPRQRSGRIG